MNKSKKMNAVAVISALGLGSVILTGCQEPKVLGPRVIIPAQKDEVVTPYVEQDNIVNPLPVNDRTITPTFEDVAPKPMKPRKFGSNGLPSSPKETPKDGKAIEYTVKKNDSLWKIARSHGTGYITLAKYNNLSTKAILRPGQKIMIPSSAEAKKMGSKKIPTTSVKSGISSKRKYQSIPKGGTYTVKRGDSLWVIARRFGVKISDLATANNIKKDAVLKLGQKLVIPEPITSKNGKSTKKSQGSKGTVTPAKVSSGGFDLPDTDTPEKKERKTDIGELPTTTSDSSSVATDVFFAEKNMTVEELSKATGVPVQQLLKLNDGLKKFKKDDMYYLPKK